MRGSPAERELLLRELDCEVLPAVVGYDGQLAPSRIASGGGHCVVGGITALQQTSTQKQLSSCRLHTTRLEEMQLTGFQKGMR